ncbi:dTDP-glucose 4,6-dehydratase [Fodinicola feengrottensis]
MLDGNRALLDLIDPANAGEVDDESELIGPVIVDAGARITRSRVIGPAVIGCMASITDSTVGAYTSIGAECDITSTDIADSIVLEGSTVSGVDAVRQVGYRALRPSAFQARAGHRAIPAAGAGRQHRGGDRAMRVMVTGGAGFIGSHYVRSMLSGSYKGYVDAQITVVDKLTYAGNTGNLPIGDPRLTFVKGDICDVGLLRELLPGHDAVVHFAAESHVDRSLVSAGEFAVTNVLGTQSVLDCCQLVGIDRVVHVSTDEVYGSIDSGSWHENTPLHPNSPYAASKAASDHFALAYFRTHRVPVMVTRCSNNYGPYQFPEKVIPLFITNLLEGQKVPLFGDGRNVREWLHVDDHCRAVQLVLESGTPGDVYHIGGGVEMTNADLTRRLVELCGADGNQVEHVPDRMGHDLRYSLDDSKIRTELGYRPEVDFGAGLAETVQWYRDNPAWWEPRREDHFRFPRGW